MLWKLEKTMCRITPYCLSSTMSYMFLLLKKISECCEINQNCCEINQMMFWCNSSYHVHMVKISVTVARNQKIDIHHQFYYAADHTS
jgi:hypothetical protein